MRRMLLLIGLAVALSGCGDAASPPDGAPAPVTSAGATPELTQLPRVGLAEIRELIHEAEDDDQILVVDFWATWCIPCVEMFPLLHDQLADIDGVRQVSITLDSPDLEEQALTFLREHDGLKDAYMLIPESDAQVEVLALSDEWNDLQVPAILVYDADGQLSRAFLGASNPAPEVERIVRHVRSLRGEEPAPSAATD